MFLLTECSSPLAFSADTKSDVDNGMSQVLFRSVTFSSAYASTGYIPSGIPIAATVSMINPRNLGLNYTLSCSLGSSFFASVPPSSPTVTSPTSVSFTFTLLPSAEHHNLNFTLGKVASTTGKTYPNDTFSTRCDSAPDSVQNLTAGQDGSHNSFIAFTLPAAPSDDDLTSLILSYQDISSGSPATSVSLPINDPSLISVSSPDVLAAITSATKRYFKPSVNAGHAYTFQVTVVDAVGQKSAPISVGTGNLQYSLTYNLNGGTGTVPAVASYLFGNSATVTATTPTSTGYTFAGWNTQANGSGLSYSPSATITMNLGNITLYAQWEYTVNFSANGALGSVPASETSASTGALTLPGVGSLTNAGYTFTGWNTAANGSGTAYAAGASYPGTAGGATLYALWSPNTNTVTFNANGGTGSMPNLSINTGASANLTANTFSRTGYTFAGWNTAAGGGGTAYSNGQSYLMGPTSITLYAQWNANIYVVTYNANGASGGAPASVSQPYNSSFTVANAGSLVQVGYSLTGWNTAANGSGTTYSAGSTYVVGASNATLYAQWTINSYSVTFSANGAGGSPPSTVTQNYNTGFTVPGAGSLTNGSLIFDGWNTAVDGSGTEYNAGDSFTITGNATLYAVWISTSPTTLPLAATVIVPSGVTALISGSTNNIFSTSGIVTETWPTTVVLPSTLTNLGYCAFHDCYGLTSITIPASVTSLGYGVFLNDTNVTVTMISTTPPSNGGAFNTAVTILVPASSLTTYQTASGWTAYAGQMVGY
jgi:uncharacterized repeat protein (TIGR02543 family)